MDITDYLGNLSLAAGRLVKASNWSCNTVIVLSFGTIAEYMHARADLLHHTIPARDGMIRRMADGYGEEFDFCGITFQLRCAQQRVTPHGPYSDVELARRGEILHRRGL